MARDFFIGGESLVLVKGRTDSAIANLTELGLATDQIRCTPNFRHRELVVNAWGEAPPDVQWMLSSVDITMNLIHVDRSVIDTCLLLSMGGDPVLGTVGRMGRAGQRLGNNLPRFSPATASPGTGYAAGNNLIGVNITQPVGGHPWCFLMCYLKEMPVEFTLGVEAEVFPLSWRCIPFTQDPYQGGLGAYNWPLWQHVLDT